MIAIGSICLAKAQPFCTDLWWKPRTRSSSLSWVLQTGQTRSRSSFSVLISIRIYYWSMSLTVPSTPCWKVVLDASLLDCSRWSWKLFTSWILLYKFSLPVWPYLACRSWRHTMNGHFHWECYVQHTEPIFFDLVQYAILSTAYISAWLHGETQVFICFCVIPYIFGIWRHTLNMRRHWD